MYPPNRRHTPLRFARPRRNRIYPRRKSCNLIVCFHRCIGRAGNICTRCILHRAHHRRHPWYNFPVDTGLSGIRRRPSKLLGWRKSRVRTGNNSRPGHRHERDHLPIDLDIDPSCTSRNGRQCWCLQNLPNIETGTSNRHRPLPQSIGFLIHKGRRGSPRPGHN